MCTKTNVAQMSVAGSVIKESGQKIGGDRIRHSEPHSHTHIAAKVTEK
jgi:hypothetical protein